MTDDDLEADLRERHRISTIGGASTIYSRAASHIAQLEANRAVWRNAATDLKAELARFVPTEDLWMHFTTDDGYGGLTPRTDLYERKAPT